MLQKQNSRRGSHSINEWAMAYRMLIMSNCSSTCFSVFEVTNINYDFNSLNVPQLSVHYSEDTIRYAPLSRRLL